MILEDLIKKEYSGSTDDLLGEMQHAFVTFMLAQNFESFEQWKAIFVLISSCNHALNLEVNEAFFFTFIPVVYAQLCELPKDFFFDDMSQDNFIQECMGQFIWNIEQSQISLRVKKRITKLKQMLVKDFKFIPLLSDEQRLVKKLFVEPTLSQQTKVSGNEPRFKKEEESEDEEDDDDLPQIVDLD